MVHFVRLSKSGNSLVVVIPAEIREALHLVRGDRLMVSTENGAMVAQKVDATTIAAITNRPTTKKRGAT